jgi:hypothetical protein
MNNPNFIYNLAFGDVAQIGDSYWRRVPGGWIVTESYEVPGRPGVIQKLHPVYVPFNDEFSIGRTEGIAGLQQVVEGVPPAKVPSSTNATITIPSRLNNEPDEDIPGF